MFRTLTHLLRLFSLPRAASLSGTTLFIFQSPLEKSSAQSSLSWISQSPINFAFYMILLLQMPTNIVTIYISLLFFHIFFCTWLQASGTQGPHLFTVLLLVHPPFDQRRLGLGVADRWWQGILLRVSDGTGLSQAWKHQCMCVGVLSYACASECGHESQYGFGQEELLSFHFRTWLGGSESPCPTPTATPIILCL